LDHDAAAIVFSLHPIDLYSHLLLLPRPKANTYFSVPRRA